MIQLEISEQDLADITEALDDPTTSEQAKRKLLCLRMHHEGKRRKIDPIDLGGFLGLI